MSIVVGGGSVPERFLFIVSCVVWGFLGRIVFCLVCLLLETGRISEPRGFFFVVLFNVLFWAEGILFFCVVVLF